MPQVNPFDNAVLASNPFNRLTLNPFSRLVEPETGLIGTIVNEIAADIVGGARTASAAVLSPFALLGANVPISFEDLSQRDLRGALMLGALGAGGFAANIARGIPLIAAMAAKGAAGRAGATAAAELVAGGAFGLLRPLEEDESRLKATLGDAALFGGLGAGASFMKSAIKATIGAQIAGIKENARRAALAQAATHTEAEALAKEMAGINLINPSTTEKIAIMRDAANSVKMITYGPEGARTRKFGDFVQAKAHAFSRGFTEEAGPFRTRVLKGAKNFIDIGVLDEIERNEGNIVKALGQIQLAEYRSVKEAARAGAEALDELDTIAAEVLLPSNFVGVPEKLSSTVIEDIAKNLTLSPQQLAQMSTSDVFKAGLKQGIITLANLEHGVSQEHFLKELFLNDLLPESANIIVNSVNDAYLTSVLTPRALAKLHPVINPLVASADKRLQAFQRRLAEREEFFAQLFNKINPEAMKRGVKIIDESAAIEDIALARETAVRNAQATGDPQVIEFVQKTTDLLSSYLEELQQVGLLTEGRSGYFPIVNSGKWRLEIRTTGGGKPAFEWKGFHTSRASAQEEASKWAAGDPNLTFNITPKSFRWERSGGGTVSMNPLQMKALTKALESAYGEDFTSAEIRDLASEVAHIGGVPAKKMGFLQPRRLGIRDFAENPLDALRIYVGATERALAFDAAPESLLARLTNPTALLERSIFAQEVESTLVQIPKTQSNLRAGVEQYRDDLLGNPRQIELTFDSIIERLGIDANPRALKRYSTALRSWESFSRLGGFWSGIVNLSQIAINTTTVLGTRWTASGFEALIKPNEALEVLLKNGVDLEMYVPLTAEGGFGVSGTIRQAFKERRLVEAAQRIALFTFNGAEKVNRLVTAWGAYKKAISEGVAPLAAGKIASDVVARTQFIYRHSNTPELLRGPAGAVLFQFKSFVINELEFMASLNKQELARFSAAIWASGGLALMLNLPGTDMLDAGSGLFFDKKISEALKLSANDPLARAIFLGVPGLSNIDVSDYLGVGSLRDVTRGLFGPAVTDLRSIAAFVRDGVADIGASGKVTNETKNRATQLLLPSAIRRAMRGQAIWTTGEVRDPYGGKLIYRPQDRARVAFLTSVGAPPIESQQERIADEIITRVTERFRRANAGYGKEAASALAKGDVAEMQRVMAEARGAGHYLDAADIRRWVRELERPAGERRRRRTPSELRQEMLELYDLTGEVPTARLREVLRAPQTR